MVRSAFLMTRRLTAAGCWADTASLAALLELAWPAAESAAGATAKFGPDGGVAAGALAQALSSKIKMNRDNKAVFDFIASSGQAKGDQFFQTFTSNRLLKV
jgi:hypothetical protein